MNREESSSLPLSEFEPRSMLRARASGIERPCHPVIDFHSHLTWSAPLSATEDESVTFNGTAAELLPVMDRKNVRLLVNLTGGYGSGLRESIRELNGAHPGRFAVFTEPWWSRVASPGYANFQADQLATAQAAGAQGLKILKTLGLFLREPVVTGPLIHIDDARFDPMWEAAGALGWPVAIHSSDPEAFFLPVDRFNERWEELHAHPDWSFHGRDFPADRELQEARRRVMRRHPRTTFVCVHVANSENLEYVSECLDEHPNMLVDIAARIGELGRQPRAARRFFDRYQDRILFGTDAVPHGHEFPQQVFGDALYEIYYRALETDDEYFEYAPAKIPPQGRWRIYGFNLPKEILKKIYWENAARLLSIER
jgi:predicted TIM-barrel fold metal-dependent hydrolase